MLYKEDLHVNQTVSVCKMQNRVILSLLNEESNMTVVNFLCLSTGLNLSAQEKMSFSSNLHSCPTLQNDKFIILLNSHT